MPAKRKKTQITIHSKETRVILGMLVFLVGVIITVTPFVEGELFHTIGQTLGLPSMIWGIGIILLSVRTIKNDPPPVSTRLLIGIFLTAVSANIFFTFWLPDQRLQIDNDFSAEGGIFGYLLHTNIKGTVGEFVEFIILIILLTISFSLISGISLEKISHSIIDSITGLLNWSRERINKGKDEINIVDNVSSLAKEIGSTRFVDDGTDDDDDIEVSEIHDSNKRTGDDMDNIDEADIQEYKSSASQYIENNVPAPAGDSDQEESSLITEPQYLDWKYPPSNLLKTPVVVPQDGELHKRNAIVIEKTLRSFGIESKISKIVIGPTVVQYALSITVGTKVAKVRNLLNDLALALATSESQIRIEAPIPGTSLIGIEIPNPTPNFVYIREMVEELNKSKDKYILPLILGKSVAGQCVIKDLATLPHLLVAGATGSGKSAGINSILTGLLMTMTPDNLRLILVDPKMVEMAPYNGVPHLLTPVITDMELVVNALQWAVEEMLRRYRILKQAGSRNIAEFNKKTGTVMPYIIIVVDEMADLMLTTGVDVEAKIVRLTQMARAVGIHLILATQRPSVDVITGLIKANVPGRIAFAVSTAIDSRVIIDQSGAEALIGKGDLLFKSPQTGRPIRLQGAFTDTSDTEALVGFIKNQGKEENSVIAEEITKPKGDAVGKSGADGEFSEDSMFNDALEVVVSAQKASASLLQRKLRIGYNRAARLIDELYEAKVIGPQEGSNPRKVLITSVDQFMGGSSSEGDEDFE